MVGTLSNEDQASIKYTVGQTRPVTVSRLTVGDTVEDRILAFAEKEEGDGFSAFGEDDSRKKADPCLTVEDMKYLFMV
ncbi:hypothetical protein HPP92_012314 [Vanilla planifolia]|uniref:Uncharacterized protein n=1 Tax=Vanilla planifolia TaxID=51239 RepID=A0A835R2C3_VANPL|nr:hypothetical protein HPP92_012314 [Vanilla planifolia]